MKLVTRDEWGSVNGYGKAAKSKLPIRNIVVHHTASNQVAEVAETSYMRQTEYFHVKGRGWTAIGYNFVIFASGNVYEGRGWGRVGAHTTGFNSASLGIAFCMDGNAAEPNDAMIASFKKLVQEGKKQGFLSLEPKISGHRDHNRTECPGEKVYAVLGKLHVDLIDKATLAIANTFAAIFPKFQGKAKPLMGDSSKNKQ